MANRNNQKLSSIWYQRRGPHEPPPRWHSYLSAFIFVAVGAAAVRVLFFADYNPAKPDILTAFRAWFARKFDIPLPLGSKITTKEEKDKEKAK